MTALLSRSARDPQSRLANLLKPRRHQQVPPAFFPPSELRDRQARPQFPLGSSDAQSLKLKKGWCPSPQPPLQQDQCPQRPPKTSPSRPATATSCVAQGARA